MTCTTSRTRNRQRQAGAAAVEFALVALFAFLPLMFGIVEFGRFFYVLSTVQEVTRRAAREQVVNWQNQTNAIQRAAVFQSATSTGSVALPGGREVTNGRVRLQFFHSYTDAKNGTNPISYPSSATAEANVGNCLLEESNCIRFVRATLRNADGSVVEYIPMVFGIFNVPLPGATVIMPAEALGLD
ncbi:TadE-like protein [Azoarcus sp. Aa7]|nr:TadE-like protein [Azoarcus sp. Aa7]